jgi:hypothetical protein
MQGRAGRADDTHPGHERFTAVRGFFIARVWARNGKTSAMTRDNENKTDK